MTAASASHRLLNFVQSALLLGLIAWSAVTAIAGPENGLLMALAMGGGLPFAPGLPRRQLLSTYQAQRLTGRDAPVSSRPWPNSHAGPGCSAHRRFIACRVGCRTPSAWAGPRTAPSASPTGCSTSSTARTRRGSGA